MSQLAEAARKLAAKGPVTLGALSREAGTSRATLYRRYGSAGGVATALRAEGIELTDKASRIFDALLQVIERRGYSGLTLDEVAREAGVSPATLYRRYRNRPGLLRAFVKARSARAAARLELSVEGPPQEVLRRVAEVVLRGAEQNVPMLRAGLAAPPAERAIFERARAPARGTEVALTRFFGSLARRKVIAPSSDAPRLARAFLALLLTEAGVFGPTPEESDLKERAAFVAELFWRGAGRGGR